MSKVLKGAGILAVCAVIAKLVGVFYRIPLTNIVGAEGIGLYQMVFPLYVVLLSVSSGGLPVAISKVVAARLASGDKEGARGVLRVSLISLTAIGLALGVLLFLFRRQIAILQGNEAAAIAYAGIAPAIVFVAIIACFRGYFQGKQNMIPSALSQLLEQAIKLGLGLALAILLMPRGIEFAVLGALLGVSASELVTAAFLVVLYVIGRVKEQRAKNTSALLFETGLDIALNYVGAAAPSRAHPLIKNKTCSHLKEIYRIAIPVTLGSLVMPLTQLIDSVLVINMLTRGGADTAAATGMFGLLTGPVGTLLNMPTIVTLSFAIALLPRVSESLSKKISAEKDVAQCLKFCFVLGILGTLFFTLFAAPTLQLLYRGGLTDGEISLGAQLLVLGSISVLYVSILQVATSVLQGANRASRPAINLLIGAVFKVVLTLLLLPTLGIIGAVIASTVCYGITALLDVFSMRKILHVNLNAREFLFGPLIAGGAFVAVALVINLFIAPHINAWVGTAASFILAFAAFIAMLLLFKSVKLGEVKRLFKRRRSKAGG